MKKPYVIAIAGCSGSGKSTLSQKLLDDLKDDYRVELLATDRYFNRPLPKMISPLSGLEYDDYNCPESLNFAKYYEDVKALITRDDLDIVILEGNYLLLDMDGWRDLASYADYTISIRADEEMLRERLIDRKMKTGVSRNESIRFVDFSDMPNVRLCLDCSLPADLQLEIDSEGEYVRRN